MTEPAQEQTITAEINGRAVRRTLPSRTMLADFLRNDLGLTGTKLSCDLQVCGVCTVLVEGRPISACTYLASDVDGKAVTTVEGLSTGEQLHPLQQAFVDNFALQCGFCTPGFLIMAKALLDSCPEPSREQIIDYLEGNICRCTGYQPIVDAVTDAAERMRGQGGD